MNKGFSTPDVDIKTFNYKGARKTEAQIHS